MGHINRRSDFVAINDIVVGNLGWSHELLHLAKLFIRAERQRRSWLPQTVRLGCPLQNLITVTNVDSVEGLLDLGNILSPIRGVCETTRDKLLLRHVRR